MINDDNKLVSKINLENQRICDFYEYHDNITLTVCMRFGCLGIYNPQTQVVSGELLIKGCQKSYYSYRECFNIDLTLIGSVLSPPHSYQAE